MTPSLYYKLTLHIVALSLFIIGVVILHQIQNRYNFLTYNLFNLAVDKDNMFDVGLSLIGIAFLMEFTLTFKPIKAIPS